MSIVVQDRFSDVLGARRGTGRGDGERLDPRARLQYVRDELARGNPKPAWAWATVATPRRPDQPAAAAASAEYVAFLTARRQTVELLRDTLLTDAVRDALAHLQWTLALCGTRIPINTPGAFDAAVAGARSAAHDTLAELLATDRPQLHDARAALADACARSAARQASKLLSDAMAPTTGRRVQRELLGERRLRELSASVRQAVTADTRNVFVRSACAGQAPLEALGAWAAVHREELVAMSPTRARSALRDELLRAAYETVRIAPEPF